MPVGQGVAAGPSSAAPLLPFMWSPINGHGGPLLPHPRPAFRQAEQSDRCQQQPGDDRPGPGERDPRLAGPEPDAQGGGDERRPEPVGAAAPSVVVDGRFAVSPELVVVVWYRV